MLERNTINEQTNQNLDRTFTFENPLTLLHRLEECDNDQKRFNVLRKLFLLNSDIDLYVLSLRTMPELDWSNVFIRIKVKRLTEILEKYKEYLDRYLTKTAERISRFEERKSQNTWLLDENITSPDVQEKLFVTRRRISRALATAVKPVANGISLRDASSGRLIRPRTGLQETENSAKDVLSGGRYKVILGLIHNRLSQRKDNPENPDWNDIQKSLITRPDLLNGLQNMEDTGGVPAFLYETDTDYVFADTSKESPEKRRDVTIGYAMNWANKNKVELMDEEQYEILQSIIKVDGETMSWLKPSEKLAHLSEKGFAIYGIRGQNDFYIRVVETKSRWQDEAQGFRCVVKVPKKRI